MIRRTHPLLLALLLAALGAALDAQAPLRIGTWNLEFLGAQGDFRNKLPLRDDEDFRKIGVKVRELGVSVLAVQEICGEAPLQKVAASAGPTWRVLLGTTGGWDDGKTAQNIGFLWDSARVELLQAEELLQLPRELDKVPIFHRVPVTAAFRDRSTGFDFRLVTVHLKAGQKDADKKKRQLEATQLKRWLDALHQDADEDQDIAVLGDFNSTYGDEPQSVFEGGGWLHYLAPKQPTPTILHFPEPIDQVVQGAGFGELQAESFAVHGGCDGQKPEEWRKTYSDHFPVTIDIVAHGDDDPKAHFARGEPGFALPKGPASAPAQAATDVKTPVWPFQNGAKVLIGMTNSPMATLEGTLLDDLPVHGQGWVPVALSAGEPKIRWLNCAAIAWVIPR